MKLHPSVQDIIDYKIGRSIPTKILHGLSQILAVGRYSEDADEE
jgi:hypothetical protein